VEGLHARRQSWEPAEHFTEHNPPVRPGLLDHARCAQCRRDIRRAADDRHLADARGQIGHAVHAVLERQDRRLRSHERRDQRQRVRIVVGFHRNDHRIDRSDFRRVLFCPRVYGEALQRRASDLQAVLADRRQVGPARDEGHVVPRTRQLRAVVPADGA